jgi:PPK2 family polyphosphate:nucleotide phosphotransferase
MNIKNFLVPPRRKIKLSDYDPGFTSGFKDKQEAQAKLAKDIEKLAELQDVLYACGSYALLIIFQAMDTAGKDGAIKHVMSGVNPQGVQVNSFKQPSEEELRHDYLWRASKALPSRGYIGIFNRSYYEEVLVVRVHKELLEHERAGNSEKLKELWKDRYQDINSFERHLVRNGTHVLKFYLNLSRDEQKRRLLGRIDDSNKNWKFSEADLRERSFWKDYRAAYEDMLTHTSTDSAPWYVIPADHKWFTRVAVADVIVAKLQSLVLRYPKLGADQKEALKKAKKILEAE